MPLGVGVTLDRLSLVLSHTCGCLKSSDISARLQMYAHALKLSLQCVRRGVALSFVACSGRLLMFVERDGAQLIYAPEVYSM